MYQWAPPGGSDSGPRGVTPSRRRSGPRSSSSRSRSRSSDPRPWNSTRAPSGSPAGGGQRGEDAVELATQVFERRRQRQGLAQVGLVLIGGEARPDGGDLEQD